MAETINAFSADANSAPFNITVKNETVGGMMNYDVLTQTWSDSYRFK